MLQGDRLIRQQWSVSGNGVVRQAPRYLGQIALLFLFLLVEEL